MRRGSSRIAITVVLFALGFLVVVQLRSQTADQGLTALSVSELTELVANVTTRNDQLREEIQALEQQRESVASSVERGDTSAGQIRSDLNRVLGWSGTMGVTGEGVEVQVMGPMPGDAIERLLNELWNAGAEAVAIGSIRVVPGVVAIGPPGSVSVTGVPLSDSLVITAIGQPQTLAGSLSRVGGPIAQLAAQFPDVEITVEARDLLNLPATNLDLGPVLGRPRL